MRSLALVLPVSFALAATAVASPPGAAERGFREGANHHLGDDGFVAQVGRAPTAKDSEQLRMRTHLQYVRDQLAGAPATQPELAERRAELLGYLDDYIAKGITPVNDALPWRSPVFIDASGNICAVGYLIERTAGRGLADHIARRHRYDYLEDIAVAVPEVRAWIAQSGFTLDELASIQPGYEQPVVEDWIRWDVAKLAPPDGATQEAGTTGTWRHSRMEGEWTRTDAHGRVIGHGELHRGRGTWTSFYPDGAKLAEGPIVDNDPHGKWTLFHPSGNVAAEGRFSHGLRDGGWRFYYDTANQTPIAIGSFAQGSIGGDWRHYDAAGKLLARSTIAGPGDGFGEYLLSIVPGADGVIHDIDIIAGPDANRFEAFFHRGERLYVHNDDIYDAAGEQLTKVDGQWLAAQCDWSTKRKRIARAGDTTTLHGLLYGHYPHQPDTSTCGAPAVITAARGHHLDDMLAQRRLVRAATPDFVREIALGTDPDPADDPAPDPGAATATAADPAAAPTEAEASEATSETDDSDLPRLLAANMVWYVEWPHVDRRFIRLFQTIPGYWRGKPNGDRRPEEERIAAGDS